MARHTTAVAVLGMLVTLVFAAPHRAVACDCCACDLTSVPQFGDIECGAPDPDCVECIRLGGVPATDCSACAGTLNCVKNTFCVGHEMGVCGLATTAAPAPTLTPWGLLAAALLLVSAGVFTLRHRMRGR
jgi:hypothetical protein